MCHTHIGVLAEGEEAGRHGGKGRWDSQGDRAVGVQPRERTPCGKLGHGRCTNIVGQVRAPATAPSSPQTVDPLSTPPCPALARPRTVNSLSQSWAPAYERVASVISRNSSISACCCRLSSTPLKELDRAAKGSIIPTLLMEKPRPRRAWQLFEA